MMTLVGQQLDRRARRREVLLGEAVQIVSNRVSIPSLQPTFRCSSVERAAGLGASRCAAHVLGRRCRTRLNSCVRRTETMTNGRPELLDILLVWEATSMRGEGLSLRDALRRARYSDLRGTFEAVDLRPLLEADPELLEVWFAYSEDKRTDGGWYLSRSGEIGRTGFPETRRRFDTPQDAVAEYVVRELEFWAGLERVG
jgi:hypothetical protein